MKWPTREKWPVSMALQRGIDQIRAGPTFLKAQNRSKLYSAIGIPLNSTGPLISSVKSWLKCSSQCLRRPQEWVSYFCRASFCGSLRKVLMSFTCTTNIIPTLPLKYTWSQILIKKTQKYWWTDRSMPCCRASFRLRPWKCVWHTNFSHLSKFSTW